MNSMYGNTTNFLAFVIWMMGAIGFILGGCIVYRLRMMWTPQAAEYPTQRGRYFVCSLGFLLSGGLLSVMFVNFTNSQIDQAMTDITNQNVIFGILVGLVIVLYVALALFCVFAAIRFRVKPTAIAYVTRYGEPVKVRDKRWTSTCNWNQAD